MRGDTKVSTEYGLIEIEKLPEFLGLYYDSDIIDINVQVPSLNGEMARASKWMYNGNRKCYKVTTKSGVSLSSTKDHKYYVYNSKKCTHRFVRLEDLKIGDLLCVNRKNPVEGEIQKFRLEYNNHKNNSFIMPKSSVALAKFLGHLVAEGFVRFENGYIQFATTCKKSMNDFESCWQILFTEFKYTVKIEEPHGYGKKKVARFKSYSPKITEFLESVGYTAKNSYEQRVPNYLFTATKEEVSAFLTRYFEGDGSVTGLLVNGCSVSTNLLYDIQLLLSSFYGIISRVRYIQRNEYRIMISSVANLQIFEREIGFFSKRKKLKLREAVCRLEEAKFSSTSKDDKVFGVNDYIKYYIEKRRQTVRSVLDDDGNVVTSHYIPKFFNLLGIKRGF